MNWVAWLLVATAGAIGAVVAIRSSYRKAMQKESVAVRAMVGLLELNSLKRGLSAGQVFYDMLSALRSADPEGRYFLLEWYQDRGQDVIDLWITRMDMEGLIFEIRVTRGADLGGVWLYRDAHSPLAPVAWSEIEPFLEKIRSKILRIHYVRAA